MTDVPVWLQITAHVVAIIGVICGILFGSLVLWPSIRRQNELAKRFMAFLDKEGKAAVSKMLEDI